MFFRNFFGLIMLCRQIKIAQRFYCFFFNTKQKGNKMHKLGTRQHKAIKKLPAQHLSLWHAKEVRRAFGSRRMLGKDLESCE